MHPCTSQSAETWREKILVPVVRLCLVRDMGSFHVTVVSDARTLSSVCRTRVSRRTSCLHEMISVDSLLVSGRRHDAFAPFSCSYTRFKRGFVQTWTGLWF